MAVVLGVIPAAVAIMVLITAGINFTATTEQDWLTSLYYERKQ